MVRSSILSFNKIMHATIKMIKDNYLDCCLVLSNIADRSSAVFLSHQWPLNGNPHCHFSSHFIIFFALFPFLFTFFLSTFLSFLSSFPLSLHWPHVGVACVLLWLQQEDYLMCRCAKTDQGVCCWKEALCCICRSPYTTTSCFRPNPHRQPCVPRPKKCKQRGSVHPGALHRTLFILSLMLLPASG